MFYLAIPLKAPPRELPKECTKMNKPIHLRLAETMAMSSASVVNRAATHSLFHTSNAEQKVETTTEYKVVSI